MGYFLAEINRDSATLGFADKELRKAPYCFITPVVLNCVSMQREPERPITQPSYHAVAECCNTSHFFDKLLSIL